MLQKYRFRYGDSSEENKDRNIKVKKDERRVNYNYENSFVSKYKAKLIEDHKKKMQERTKLKEEINSKKEITKPLSEAPIVVSNLEDEDTKTNFINEAKAVICTYCSRTIEAEEFEQCHKCITAKYCNDFCKSKDSRFHSRKCVG